MKLLLVVLFSAIVSASAQSEETCEDLEQLVLNTNPDLLTKCEFDEGCTFVLCQSAGAFADFFGTMTITLEPCVSKPGVKIDLLQKDGTLGFSELVTAPTVITRDFSAARVTVSVFVNGGEKSIGLSMDPVTIDLGELGFTSDFLINFTSISIDQSNCKFPSTGVEPTPRNESPPNMDTCLGLDELAMNVNPTYLAECSMDDICSQVTCEATSGLGLESVSFFLDICNGQPGMAIELSSDGRSLFNQLVTNSTTVTAAIGNTTLEAEFFLNSTSNYIAISVDSVTITDSTPVNGTVFVTDMLVNFTIVPFNTSYCSFAIVEAEFQNAGMSVMLALELFLLTVAALCMNSAQ